VGGVGDLNGMEVLMACEELEMWRRRRRQRLRRWQCQQRLGMANRDRWRLGDEAT